MYHNKKNTALTNIDTTTQQNDLETPQKLLFHPLRKPPSTGSITSAAMAFLLHLWAALTQPHSKNTSVANLLITPLQEHSQLLLASIPDVILSLPPAPCSHSSACQSLPTTIRMHPHNMHSWMHITINKAQTPPLPHFGVWDSPLGPPYRHSSSILTHHWYNMCL